MFLIISRVPDAFPSLHLGLVTAGLTAALALLDAHRSGRSPLRFPESRALLALLLLSILTVPFSYWPGRSFTFAARDFLLDVFLFLVIIHCVKSVRALQLLLSGVLAAMFVLEISLILWGRGDRPYVTATYDSNDLAFIMVCGFPIAATWLSRGHGPLRYVAGLVSALAVLTVVLTRSRGGLLGLGVVMALLLLTASPRHRLRTAVVVLTSVLVLGAFSSAAYRDRMATIWGGNDQPAGAPESYDATGVWGARWPVWRTALQLMLEHPVVGVGVGAYEVAEGYSHGGKGKWSAAHNAFLQIGAELGVLGLAFFIFFLYRGVRNCRRVIRLARQRPEMAAHAWLARSVELSLYGYIATALGLSQAYSSIPYVLVAMSIVLLRLVPRHTARPRPWPGKPSAGQRTSFIRAR
jgi:O-antigen ligase